MSEREHRLRRLAISDAVINLVGNQPDAAVAAEVGEPGKTRGINVRFRRPTPILTDLRFDITRSQADSRIEAVSRLMLDDEVLCVAEISTVSVPADKLITTQFGKRHGE